MSLFGPKTVNESDFDYRLQRYRKAFAGPINFAWVDFYDPSSVSVDRLERAIVDAANEMGTALCTERVKVKHGGLFNKSFTDGIEVSVNLSGVWSGWDTYVVDLPESCARFRAYRMPSGNTYARHDILDGKEPSKTPELDSSELDWYKNFPVILQKALDTLNAGKVSSNPDAYTQVFNASDPNNWGGWDEAKMTSQPAPSAPSSNGLDVDEIEAYAHCREVCRPEPGTGKDECLEFVVEGHPDLDFVTFMGEVKYRMENVFSVPVVVTQVDPANGNERFVISAAETGMFESKWNPFACVKVCDRADTRLYVYQMDGELIVAMNNIQAGCASRDDNKLFDDCQPYFDNFLDYRNQMDLSFSTTVATLNGWKAN